MSANSSAYADAWRAQQLPLATWTLWEIHALLKEAFEAGAGGKVGRKNKFSPPSVEEVAKYCAERDYRSIDAEAFVAFYESKSWFVGKNPMTNWRMAVVTWSKSRQNGNGHSKPAAYQGIADFLGAE